MQLFLVVGNTSVRLFNGLWIFVLPVYRIWSVIITALKSVLHMMDCCNT